MSETYQRPGLTKDEQEIVNQTIWKVQKLPVRQIYRILEKAITENALLLKECNEHRQARGFEQLVGFTPESNSPSYEKSSKKYRHH